MLDSFSKKILKLLTIVLLFMKVFPLFVKLKSIN